MKSSFPDDDLYNPIRVRRLRDTFKPVAYILLLCGLLIAFLHYRKTYDVYCFYHDTFLEAATIEHYSGVVKIDVAHVQDDDRVNVLTVTLTNRENVAYNLRAKYCKQYMHLE